MDLIAISVKKTQIELDLRSVRVTSLRLPCRDFYLEEKQAKVSIAMKPTLNSDSNVKELALNRVGVAVPNGVCKPKATQ
jgi:hypothetical protein